MKRRKVKTLFTRQAHKLAAELLPPPGFSESAAKMFASVLPMLEEKGRVEQSDIYEAILMARWWGQYVDAASMRDRLVDSLSALVRVVEVIADNHPTIEEEAWRFIAPMKVLVEDIIGNQPAYIRSQLQASEAFCAIADKFGLNPKDRKKLAGPAPKKEKVESPMDAFRARQAKLGSRVG